MFTHSTEAPHSENTPDELSDLSQRARPQGGVGQQRDHISQSERQDEVGGDVVSFRDTVSQLRQLKRHTTQELVPQAPQVNSLRGSAHRGPGRVHQRPGRHSHQHKRQVPPGDTPPLPLHLMSPHRLLSSLFFFFGSEKEVGEVMKVTKTLNYTVFKKQSLLLNTCVSYNYCLPEKNSIEESLCCLIQHHVQVLLSWYLPQHSLISYMMYDKYI